jgi:sugar lactone lactonase YvrE
MSGSLATHRFAPCLPLAAVVAACSPSPTAPTAPSHASAILYVANLFGQRITAYSPSATGNATPAATIAGSNTSLNFPYGIARDTAGRLYVANLGASAGSPEALTVYAADAVGNVAPIAIIAGSNTGLHNAQGIAVDAAGRFYVANLRDGGSHGDSITVFAANATGNVAPAATIAGSSTGLNVPWGIALAADDRLYVANTGGNSITIYAPRASGNVAPLATIAGANTGLISPTSIALDAAGQLYVENTTLLSNHAYCKITVYAPRATGNIAPVRTIGGGSTAPCPVGIAVDGAGRLYVAGGGSIIVYARDATGNGAPIATIAGNNTGLSGAAYITF